MNRHYSFGMSQRCRGSAVRPSRLSNGGLIALQRGRRRTPKAAPLRPREGLTAVKKSRNRAKTELFPDMILYEKMSATVMVVLEISISRQGGDSHASFAETSVHVVIDEAGGL